MAVAVAGGAVVALAVAAAITAPSYLLAGALQPLSLLGLPLGAAAGIMLLRQQRRATGRAGRG
jgi:hypothetical protein